MKLRYANEDGCIEVGVDEVARGCWWGRVYSAAVIWGDELPTISILRDSKTLSRQQRLIAYDYILDYALDTSVAFAEADEIDRTNILQTTHRIMHQCIDTLNIHPDMILVDGNTFVPYQNIPHVCVPQGDSQYYSIAAASILAKVEHDQYITDLCRDHPEFQEKYHLLQNMGYGTAAHREGIERYGIVHGYHRESFRLPRRLT